MEMTRSRHAHRSIVLMAAIVACVAVAPAMAQEWPDDLRARLGFTADDTGFPSRCQRDATDMGRTACIVRLGSVVEVYRMASKFKDLAEAMDSDLYGWRPMEGVRSVSEVFMLIVAENYALPVAWGAAPPEGRTVSASDDAALYGELAEVTDKSDVLKHLEASADHLLDAVADISDEQMTETFQLPTGQEVTVMTYMSFFLFDMHEHLGQAIAYARMNEVVPPWTARQGQ